MILLLVLVLAVVGTIASAIARASAIVRLRMIPLCCRSTLAL